MLLKTSLEVTDSGSCTGSPVGSDILASAQVVLWDKKLETMMMDLLMNGVQDILLVDSFGTTRSSISIFASSM